MAKLVLEHPDTGIVKRAPVGFSLTTLLFPSLPALFRGDIKGFFVQLVLDGLLVLPIFVFPFIYNKMWIKRLLTHGYKLREVEDGDAATMRRRLGIRLPELDRLSRANKFAVSEKNL